MKYDVLSKKSRKTKMDFFMSTRAFCVRQIVFANFLPFGTLKTLNKKVQLHILDVSKQ